MPAVASRWYDFVLQQVAAESYLESLATFEPGAALAAALRRGNNRSGEAAILPGLSRMTAAQVGEFTRRFRIVHQWSDDPSRTGNVSAGDPGYLALDGRQILANTGLSATLVRNIDPASADHGTLTLAIRSSEYASVAEGGDRTRDIFGADAGAILATGMALAQLDALDRYVTWLRAQGLLGAGETFNLTGFSLGGHLATLYAELHPENILHAYTFNGAGRGEWNHALGGLPDILAFYRAVLADPEVAATLAIGSANQALLDAARQDASLDPVSLYEEPRYQWAMQASLIRFQLVGNALFLPLSDPARTGLTNGAADRVTQIFGRAFGADTEAVSNSGVHGPATAVFIEDQPLFQGLLPGGVTFDYANTHSLTLLADSLALLRLFGKMDPAATLPQLARVLAAASAESASTLAGGGRSEGNSLERIVEALGRLWGVDLLPMAVDRSGWGFANILNRDAFHENLERIDAGVSGDALHVVGVPDLVPEQVALLARQEGGVAYRYALRHLDPFVVVDDTGAAYRSFDQGQPRHAELAYAAGSHDATLTDEWIRDRAALLVAMVQANIGNQAVREGVLIAAAGMDVYTAYDAPGGVLFVRAADVDETRARHVTFGDFADNRIEGTAGRDHLYGAEGDDLLLGLGGDDLLQGGPGNDDLRGDEGDDLLHGGAGDDALAGGDGEDTLDGGANDDHLKGGRGDDALTGGDGADVLEGGMGNDCLLGGLGFDIYVCALGEGVDTLRDLDGQGKIVLDGADLSSATAFRRVNNVWISETGATLTLSLVGGTTAPGTLLISGPAGGQLRLEGFRNGDLGVFLSEENAHWPFVEASPVFADALATNALGTEGDDYAIARADNALFFGDPGDDTLGDVGNVDYAGIRFYGNAGNDTLAGSLSSDNGHGGDTLVGGGGADRLFGGSHDDALWGEGTFEFRVGWFRVDAFAYYDTDGPALDEADLGIYLAFPGDLPIESAARSFGANAEQALRFALGLGAGEVPPGFYDDFVEGGWGNDQIRGEVGSDRLYGGPGDDDIEGDSASFAYDPHSEFLYLRPLLGRYGDDLLDGGDGNDILVDRVAGSDTFLGGPGDDVLTNEEKWHASGLGNLLPSLADGLTGQETFDNYLDGGAGNDRIRTLNTYAGSHDRILGGAGNDQIEANGYGVDIDIDAGEGDDLLLLNRGGIAASGGPGSDLYRIALAVSPATGLPGAASLDDRYFSFRLSNRDSSIEDEDLLEANLLGSIAELEWSRQGQDLVLSLGELEAWVTIEHWFEAPQWKMDRIRITTLDPDTFAQALHEWTSAEIDRMAVWKGTAASDLMLGNDDGQVISGGGGDDILAGGAGNDVLAGGDGNDTYRFGLDAGHDVIEPAGGGQDRVELDGGLGVADVLLEKNADDLVLKLHAGGSLTLRAWFADPAAGVAAIHFHEGETWTRADIAGRLGVNHAPVALGVLEAVQVVAGEPIAIDFEEGLFEDPDPGDVVRYAVGARSGAPLPEWLDFDPARRTLSGTVPMGSEGTLALFLHGVDRFGARASLPFDLFVPDGNHAPVLVTPLPDRSIMEAAAFGIAIPRGAFLDADPSDALTLAVRLADGSALPAWMHFDDRLAALLGTSPEPGRYSILISATDRRGATVADAFEIEVIGHPGMTVTGTAAADVLLGTSGEDAIDGGPGADRMAGGRGDDTYAVDHAGDAIVEGAGEGEDRVISAVSYQLPAWVEHLELTGRQSLTGQGNGEDNRIDGNAAANVLRGLGGDDVLNGNDGADNLQGGEGNDVLAGGEGDDRLDGGSGRDLLQGHAGADVLAGAEGRSLLDGGAGNDVLAGGAEADLFIGGAGNDAISTGDGANLVAFNRGDGRDVISGAAGSRNTLSLGKGIAVGDLQFEKVRGDLVLRLGASDQVTFKDWYAQPAQRTFTNLQFVLEAMRETESTGLEALAPHKVATFDFQALAADFDAGGQVSGWALTEALLDAHLAFSDTEAVGGDLAYQYGLRGHTLRLGADAMGGVIADPRFGEAAQAFAPDLSVATGLRGLSGLFSGLKLP
ncbi:MAG TPA: putative Ig domain-containing protein [Burkholderiales bacterium]|nr:putative Ig domain-containing protein [Burkholderiales bacterium]